MINSNKKKPVCGVGINDADYLIHKYEYKQVNGKNKRVQIWVCPYYLRWHDMLTRCYSSPRLRTYSDCSVCEEWLTFSNFKDWMEKQNWVMRETGETLCLDKDILFIGNKVYSPKTCVFIPQSLNKLLLSRSNERGLYPIGVHWSKNANKFVAQCGAHSSKNSAYLGVYRTAGEAHRAWQKAKIEHMELYIEFYKTLSCYIPQVEAALRQRINSVQQDILDHKETIRL